jgi:HSP20 family protein
MRALVPFYNNQQVSNVFKEMDEIFSNWSSTPLRSWEYNTHFTEAENHFSLAVDMPGLKKADLKLEIQGQSLSVSGESKREGTSRTYRRVFTLPESVDTSKIEAKFEDGVLELHLPKMETAKSRLIEIQ